MALSVVTSCSASGWAQYGQRFLTSFDQFWPLQGVELHIVSEDPLPLPDSIVKKRVVRFWDLNQSKAAAFFAKRYKDNPKANGFSPSAGIARDRSKRTGYDYRRDAFRFSKKIFAINMVMPVIRDNDRFIWLDADTVSIKPVPITLFDKLPPPQFALAYLDRAPYHSECGFVGYNLSHPATRPFLREFSRLYESDEVFKLEEWHDSWVFDWLRVKFRTPSYKIPYSKPHVTHPFVYSELGEYMDHLKGARKQRGVSHDHPRFGKHHQNRHRSRTGLSSIPHYPRRQPIRRP